MSSSLPPEAESLPVLELDHVIKAYPGDPPLEVLHGVNLTICEGELVAVVGPQSNDAYRLQHAGRARRFACRHVKQTD